MRARILAGIALVLVAGLAISQQSTIGGLASRLRLTSLGVNTAAPAAGNITATGTVQGASVTATGALTGATASVASVDITPATNTAATASVFGCTTVPTPSVKVERFGRIVVVQVLNGVTCTGNQTSFSILAAVPAGYRPASITAPITLPECSDNGGLILRGACWMWVNTVGDIQFAFNGSTTGWTAAGLRSFGGFTLVFTQS